jgi:rubredoxin
MFRCLKCGYLGRGNHPDPDIDAEIAREMDAAEAWNEAHGLPGTPIGERRP